MFNNDIFRGVGVEITLVNDENFLKIKETLTRIGVTSKTEKRLFQTAHILHKRGRYVITHFKEMFILDGKTANIDEDDIKRRNTIIDLLQQWGFITVVDPEQIKNKYPTTKIKIIPFSEKDKWELVSKYTVGKGYKTN